MKTLQQIREASGGKEKYQKFVNTMLKKFGVKSPAELEGDKKKKFYDALDAGWDGDNEEPEKGDVKEDTITEASIAGVTKALDNLASKPEYKKIANALKGLANPVNKSDKKVATAINKRLKQLATKVDKKAGAKLLKIADLASTYESVELEEVKKGETFSKKEAEVYFKKQYGSKFNAKKMGTETDDKGNKYWMDKGHSGEAVPMKEEVELDEIKEPFAVIHVDTNVVVATSSSEKDAEYAAKNPLNKKNKGKLKVVKTRKKQNHGYEFKEAKQVSLSKKGEYNLVANGKTSSGIMLSLQYKGKQITTGTKKDGMFIMAFDAKFVKDNKLDHGAKIIKKGKWTHVGFKTADDVIAYAVLGGLSESTISEKVDMRTKGFKEAIARSLLLKTKREEKKAKLEAQKQKEMEEEIANSTGVNIAGVDKPLGKVNKRKSFKDSL